MVKPVTEENQQSLEVYLPGDEPWYEFEDGNKFDGDKSTVNIQTPKEKIPVLQRGGSIIPIK